MASNFRPAEEVSDYSSDDDEHGWLGSNGDGSSFGDPPDGLLIDEWVHEAEEEGWTTCSSDADDENILYTDGVPVKKIFVANFGSECTESDFGTFFSKFGNVTDVSILEGKSKPYAFVTFETPESAFQALRAPKKDVQLRWNRLKIFPAHSWHQPKEQEGEEWKRDTSEVKEECLINKLNDDCLIHIMNFLPIRDQVKIERVCRRWQDLSTGLWLRRTTIPLDMLVDRHGRFSVPAFRKALRFCGDNLVELDFTTVTSDGLSAVVPLITRQCPNLIVLKMCEVTMNPCAIQNLCKKCRKLQHLSLNDCQGIRDGDLIYLLERCNKLMYLSLSRNSSITGQFLKAILPATKTLILDECNNLNMENVISVMMKQSCAIHRLSLNSCQTLTTSDVQRLCEAGANKLKHLELNGYFPRLNSTSLRALGSLKELVSLQLKFNSSVKSEVILEICRGCRNLEELDISGVEERDQNSQISKEALDAIARLPQLRKLFMNYMNYNNTFLETLATYARKLVKLQCMGCPGISSPGVCNVLNRCEHLASVDLSGCYIQPSILNDAVLAVNSGKDRPTLTLHLGGTQVTRADVAKVNEQRLEINLVDHSKRHLRPDFNDDIYLDHFLPDDGDFFEGFESDDTNSIDEENLAVLLNLLAG